MSAVPRRGSATGAAQQQRTSRAPRVHVGCSGWNYASWRGLFYPSKLPAARWLEFYAARFATVEINNSFYRLPEETVFADWRARVPPGFVFAVKASRFLTHMKKLRDPHEPLQRLFSRASALQSALGPVLYQLPSTMRLDLARLEPFLEALPPRHQHVVEFRDPSWYVAQTFALLERHGVSLCLHDKAGSAIASPIVGPFVYVRFHGTNGHYHGSYSDAALAGWAERLVEAWQAGRDVFAYFNNDPNADAVRDATRLEREIGRVNAAAAPQLVRRIRSAEAPAPRGHD